MFYLVYVSSAVTPFTPAELTALLTQARTNNAALGVTGLLLYKDGNSMQLIEGDESVVRALHAKILTDPRHKGALTLTQGTQPARQFPDWSMGFHDLADPAVQATPGYNAFLKTPLTAVAFAADPTRGQKLLLTFKKHM